MECKVIWLDGTRLRTEWVEAINVLDAAQHQVREDAIPVGTKVRVIWRSGVVTHHDHFVVTNSGVERVR